MSTYGNNPYSTITYGPYSLVTFDATPVTATPTDHGVITVTWNKPTGSWDLLHVVRNTYGYPVTPDDGDMLLELTPTSTVYTYVDNNNGLGLTQGLTYYYTIFVRQASPQKWFSAGSAEGWSVYDYGTAAAMYDALPEIYKSPASDTYYLNTIIDPITGKPISEANDGKNIDLYNFLQVFGFEYDLFKTQATNVKDRYKVLSVNGDLIPTMLNQFGFTYEKELGLQQARKLLSNAWAIYSRRGTVAGLKNFVTAYSGYNATLLPIKNLMLSTNDSSFASSIGFWETISNATISQISGAGESPVVTPYNESTSPSDFPNISTGIMKAVATASGAMSFADGLSAPRTKGIPVTAGLAYSLSLYSIAKTTARSITLTVNWYDKYGVLLSTSAGASGNNALSNWTRVSATNQVAPANAYFAVPVVSIAGNGAREIHYLDAVQFEQSTTITNFVDARRIDILLNANRVNWCSNPNFEASSGTTTVRTNLVTNPSFEASSGTVTVRTNLITNPSFETNTTGWNPAGAVSGSLTRVTTDAYVGTASAQMAWTGAGLGYIEQSNTASAAASAGATYTGSIYVKQTVGSARSISLNFNWWNSSNAYISTTSGTASTTVIGSWVRYSITATAPATTASVGFQVYLGTVASGDTFLIDAALTEQSSILGTYFDGSTTAPDGWTVNAWTGTANASTSTQTVTAHTDILSYNRVGVITGDYLVGFNCVLRFNSIGTWTMTLPANHRLQSSLTTPGAGIVVTLLGNTLFSGPVTWYQTLQTMNDAVGVTQITGLDDSVLLRDRLAYPTPTTSDVTAQTSAYDVRTGFAESVMKAYVNANMGPSAPLLRKYAPVSYTHLTLPTNREV